jgi:SanA protein
MWLLVCLTLLFAALLGVLALVHRAQTIPSRIRGKCYDDVTQVPTNRVGLVLGCTRYLTNGHPNVYFAHRMEAAAALFRAGKVELLLASGASHRAEIDEAASMKEALVELGVPASCVVCDPHGYRTIDSVLRAKGTYGQSRFTIISQPFHNHRAIYVAERRGIEAVGFNARDVALPRARAVSFREFLARLRVLIDIHVKNTRPRVQGDGRLDPEPKE